MILGIATAFCYSGYLLIIRWGGRDIRRPAGPVAVATVCVVVASFVVGEVVGDLDLTPGPQSLFWLALLGITAQSAGYLLISISLPRAAGDHHLGHPADPAGDVDGPRDRAARRDAVADPAARGRPSSSAGSPAATVPVGAGAATG